MEYSQCFTVLCLSLHFWCTGSIDSWLWMQAAAWLKLRCVWIKQTGTAFINLCVEIKASHTWKAGSPWFPLVLGLVAMGVEGAIGRGKAQSDRQDDSVIFPCTLPNHAQFILPWIWICWCYFTHFLQRLYYFILHVVYLITVIMFRFVKIV